MQEGSGNSDSLFLTAREGISQLSDFRIVALRQGLDKLVNIFPHPRLPGLLKELRRQEL